MELNSPLFRQNHPDRSHNTLRTKTQRLNQREIISSLQHKNDINTADIRNRATKIACTLGHNTKHVKSLKKMLDKGMDVARLNMNYFEVNEQAEIIGNIK